MDGEGTVIGKKAPNFTLPDHLGETFSLEQNIKNGPVLLAFYPNDFTIVCTKQLCNYSDHLNDFKELGISIVGISHNPAFEHSRFAKKFEFQFKLLSDADYRVANLYNCTSRLMLGKISRAVFIVNTKGIILYRYVEPTTLTHRNAKELLAIVQDLHRNKII